MTTNIQICTESQRQQDSSCEKHQETLQHFAGHWWQGNAAKQAQKLAQSSLFQEDRKTPDEFRYGPSPHGEGAAAAAPGRSVFLLHVLLRCRPRRSPERRVQQALSCRSLTRYRHATAPLVKTIIS